MDGVLKHEAIQLQIHNGVDSANAPFIEAQNMALLHLSAQSLSCPVPHRTKNGGFTASIQLPAKVLIRHYCWGMHQRCQWLMIVSYVLGV
jgi:Ser/Thr protein kinase RdoA (MazF antagonist)